MEAVEVVLHHNAVGEAVEEVIETPLNYDIAVVDIPHYALAVD